MSGQSDAVPLATPTTEAPAPRQGVQQEASLKRARPQRQPARDGDPELTEPDSDEDSLYGTEDGSVPLDSLQPQILDGSGKLESLTEKAVVERRLRHLKELYRLYKVEYWGLLEELNTRHQRFAQKQAEGGEALPGNDHAASGTRSYSSSLREELKHRGKSNESGGDTEMRDAPAPEPAGGNRASQPGAAELPASQEGEFDNPFQRFSNQPIRDDVPPYGDELRGYGSEEDPATFSDVEAVVLERQPGAQAASKQKIQEWRAKYRRQLPRLQRLEQAASASSMREMDKLGALACLCGRHNRFLIKTSAVSLGRATDATQVDIDLSSEGDARKVSRHQAHISLQPDGRFRLKNVGRRTVLVNNRQVDQGQVAMLGHLSLVEVGGVRLLFMVNHAAVKRASGRTTRMRA